MVGEGLYWAASTLVGALGAHILAVFLFLAAVLLLTGATWRAWSTRRAARSAPPGGGVREQSTEVRERVARRQAAAAEDLATLEAADSASVTRAPDAGFWSGEERYPELFDEADGDETRAVAAGAGA